jgi:ABC-type multidrug transport system fused ATPase/permease subunit
MLDTLFETMRHKISLFIAHGLVGLEQVDEILVMENGRITERGTHEELLSQKGLYRRLWDLQNQILSPIEQATPISQI